MSEIKNIIKDRYKTTAEIDGIQFNNIKHTGTADASPHILDNNIWQHSAATADKLPYSVNAVDINWNGAVLQGNEINSTGEVLTNIQLIENILTQL